MQLLSLPQPLNLVRHSRIRVVGQIGSDLVVPRREDRRTRPPRDVEDLEVRRHLRHLDRVDSSHRRERLSLRRRARESCEELLGRDVGGVKRGDGLSASLRRDEFGGVGPLGRCEARGGEPRFDRGDLRTEVGFLLCCCRLVEAEERCGVGGGRGGEGARGHAEGAGGGDGEEGAGGDAGVGGGGAEAARSGAEHRRLQRRVWRRKCGVRRECLRVGGGAGVSLSSRYHAD